MTGTAGAIIGCRRWSAFWGLGCPKTHHEIKDSLGASADENALAVTEATGEPDRKTGDEAIRITLVQSEVDQELPSKRRVPAILVIHLALLGGTVSG